jgi:hypothetical protein
MDKASVNGQKKRSSAVPAERHFFWQTPMVQRFEIVCTATCASG